VSSQGERFRRRATRRGYKVDEVDAFLDRVEATLAGEPIGAPVASQEVHDVVFRVRFGGYDEWQVDLHLDRVERQLAELEERGPAYARDLRPQGPPLPKREERPSMPPSMPPPSMPQPPPMPTRPAQGVPTGAAPQPFGNRYDEPSGGYAEFERGRHGKAEMTQEMRATGPARGGSVSGLVNEAVRIDQLRRAFQVRRFGSGYDRAQVDRLFDGLVSAMSGRSGVPVTEAELNPAQFSLVQGGYFEAEVDAALKEVRDIVSRRR
jgi:DivIVA domain-containing protein